MEVLQYKCPCCGAPLAFSSSSQQLSCRSCGNDFPVETVQDFEELSSQQDEAHLQWKHKGEEDTAGLAEQIGDGLYECPSCGGHVEADEHTASTTCPYCDNVVLIRRSLSGSFTPDCLIPFKVEAEEAKQILRKLCKGKRLLPKHFLDDSRIKEIKGYYVPYWLFDCEVSAAINFDATRVRFWMSGEYNYTETSYYLVHRAGAMRFARIPVDGSSKIDNAITEAIEPFDYQDLVDFEPAYLAGYEADKYDVSAEEAMPRVNERVCSSTEDALRDTVIGYNTVIARNRNVQNHKGEVRYALLPVWLLEASYAGKKYPFAINGQTGRMIGTLPVDKRRLWGYLIGMTGIGTAVLSILGILLGGGL